MVVAAELDAAGRSTLFGFIGPNIWKLRSQRFHYSIIRNLRTKLYFTFLCKSFHQIPQSFL